MKHLGDITKIKGCIAPVVDCVIGGSPCQDLSVAGKRAGLAGERSGLYMEQIRIIKEMRHKDELRGRTGEYIRPRYMVWENVPGAFSSNQGKDFAAVIEEAIKVADPEAAYVRVPEKGWPTSGCYFDELGRWSVAWRVLDAQFWGVPQRRRRIALVADFGGQSAPEILFIRKGVSRDLDESEQARKATAGDAESGIGADDREGKIADAAHREGNGTTGANLFGTGRSSQEWDDHQGPAGIGAVGFPLGFRPENVRCYEEVATTLCNGTRPGFTTGVIQPVAFDTYNMDVAGDKTVTLRAGAEHNYAPVFQPVPLEPGIAAREGGHIYEGVSGTLRAKAGDNQMAVAYGINGNIAGTLDGSYYKGCGERQGVEREIVVQPIQTYQKVTGPLMANSHPGSYTGQDAYSDMLVAGPVAHGVDCRNATEYEECTGALQADAAHSLNNNNVVRVRYIVRRLTPLECERLQGYPDGWTDIGEWVDSKGKRHKEADSPRYKALGNSIALPPWKWVLKRLCACYERDATMASLFDGIGGFPYIWEQFNGKGSCLWASEIEEFPMAVTKVRFGNE